MSTAFPMFFVEVSAELGRYKNLDEKASQIAARFPPAKYKDILDICCGIGDFAGCLRGYGYQVAGIDLSAEQISYAQSNHPDIEFLIADMEDIPEKKYDIILNTYSSFGYRDTSQADTAVLKTWFARLRSGGLLIMELTDLEKAKINFNYPNNSITRKSGSVTERLTIDWETQILDVTYSKQMNSYNGFTRIYSSSQITQMLAAAGFEILTQCGDFGHKTKEREDRLVITCVKP